MIASDKITRLEIVAEEKTDRAVAFKRWLKENPNLDLL
jgi:GrpB-like predicted nucleotidyltransferase (UPF0157 family)